MSPDTRGSLSLQTILDVCGLYSLLNVFNDCNSRSQILLLPFTSMDISNSKLRALYIHFGKMDEGIKYLMEFVRLTKKLYQTTQLPKYKKWLDWAKSTFSIDL